MNYDELYHDIGKILPRATFGVDNNQQLIIYTDMMFGADNRELVKFKVSSEWMSKRCQEGNHESCPNNGVGMAWNSDARAVVNCGCSCHLHDDEMASDKDEQHRQDLKG